MLDVLLFIVWLAVSYAAIYAVVALRARMAARAAVRADCLVCTYTEPFKDVRTATAAGNAHGDKTGHPLILVRG